MEKLKSALELGLKEANFKQNEKRTREMSLVITKIEEAQLWLSKL